MGIVVSLEGDAVAAEDGEGELEGRVVSRSADEDVEGVSCPIDKFKTSFSYTFDMGWDKINLKGR